MDINWDDQPKGYPVWIEDLDGGMSGWHRDDGDRYTSENGCYWTKPGEGYYTAHFKPWSGDGLPPIGIVCEVENPHEAGQWCECKILAWDAECAVFSSAGEYPYVYDGQGLGCFRPIQTSGNAREAAIKDLMRLDDIYHEQAAAIYDAGYRKVSP